MDNETKLPMDWKPLREAAERLARETWAANVRRFEENGWSTVELHGGDEYAMEGLRLFSLAQADLLADLGRPNSRLTWVFWLQQQQVEPPPGWTWWEIVSDADSAPALRAALLAVVPHV